MPFKAVDLATDEKAKRLWARRAGKDEGGRIRKLPGLFQEGFIVGVCPQDQYQTAAAAFSRA